MHTVLDHRSSYPSFRGGNLKPKVIYDSSISGGSGATQTPTDNKPAARIFVQTHSNPKPNQTDAEKIKAQLRNEAAKDAAMAQRIKAERARLKSDDLTIQNQSKRKKRNKR